MKETPPTATEMTRTAAVDRNRVRAPRATPVPRPAVWTVDLCYSVLGLHVKELAKDPELGLALRPDRRSGSFLVYADHLDGYQVHPGFLLAGPRIISSRDIWPEGYQVRAMDGLLPQDLRMVRVDHPRRTLYLWPRGT
jgi:hypothetical protein